jgi:predicted TIM-barrel fold metal-dependent hydrolase
VLSELDSAGVRAVRFNWISHLLAKETRSEQQRFTDAEGLLQRVSRLAWHVELHVDIAYLEIASRLNIPSGMPVVIDHMARIDASASTVSAQVASLLRLMDRHSFWVKLSGADRLTANQEDLRAGLGPIRQILKAAPERCVWGLDWPHVNLARKRSDPELADLVLEAANNEKTLERVLIDNPQQLYGFHSLAH